MTIHAPKIDNHFCPAPPPVVRLFTLIFATALAALAAGLSTLIYVFGGF
jgi:hypothetical protein